MVARRRKTSRRKSTRRKSTRRKSSKRKKSRRKKPAFGGYKIKPDANFAKIIGSRPVSPSQMTKKVWAYIKRKRLARK
jgi:chromatin remodeling complex protein RSC6